MARRLVVEIVGDASSLERAFAKSTASSTTWRRSLLGSAGATLGLSSASKTAEKDVGKFSRGLLAGSGIASHLGRSLAFASGGFLAFAGASEAIHSSVEGAEELQKATDSLAVVIRRANGDVGKAIPLLDRWAKAQKRLGVSETEALVGLRSTAVLTGSVQKGMLAYTMGLELARAENISMNSAMRISAKALLGQTTSLTRYGIVLPKTTNAQKIFNAFQARFANQAETNTSAFDRLRAAATNLEISVGRLLIPIFEKYATRLEEWISKSQNQKRVLDAVSTTVRVLTETFGALFKAGQVLFAGLERLKNLFGSWKPVIIGITAALVALGLLNPWLALAAGAIFVIAHWKTVETFFRNLGREIVNSFKYVWYQLQRGALLAALAVVEPFSHLPGFLGHWARVAKDRMQGELARLHPPNMNWGGYAAQAGFNTGHAWRKGFARGVAGVVADAFADVGAVFKNLGNRRRPGGSVFGTDTGAGTAPKPAASSTKGFDLPFRLQLAQARAAATSTLRDDIKVAREIRAFILKMIPHLHGQKLIDAYNQLGAINQQIADDVKQAAGAGKRAVSFVEPLKLQLALARDTALGLDPTKDLLRLKALILRFIRTHKHNIKALIDAYQQLADVNQQLAQGTGSTNAYGDYKKASLKALTTGLGLSADAMRRLQARLSQVGPGGTTPMSGTGAAGFIIDPNTGRPIRGGVGSAASDQPIFKPTINVYVGGRQVEAIVTNEQHRRRRHNPTQRRGPNAATATA